MPESIFMDFRLLNRLNRYVKNVVDNTTYSMYNDLVRNGRL